jgi:hypothetical protein
VASKSGQQEPEKAEVIEELLDALDTALDRVKVLYEQYFLGIQKQPPAYLHTDIERKIRDLAQIQIRNTALRYRFATLQQKYGSYNSYWRRTLRQIENGTYTRNLYKVGRQAAKTGAAVPEEILAAMPRRMRDQVVRDREAALALARLRERQVQDDELLTLADDEVDIDVDDLDAAFIHESSDVRRNALTAGGAHRVDESDAEFDVDAFFASVTQDDAPSRDTLSRPAVADPTEAEERSPRSSRPSSRPPAVARPATGHPRPASASGSPVAATPPGAAARGRRPSTRRPPTDEGPPSFAEVAGATRRSTGSMRAIRPPSSPGIEPPPPPRSATGRMPVARPPSSDPEPRLSIPPIGAASPAASTRKITGPMRAVRPPSIADPEPGDSPPIDPVSAAPVRATGQAASRPVPGDPEPRLSIPPIGAARPAAATRRITPPSRAVVRPPSDADPDLAGPPGAASPGRATAERRAATAPGADARPPRRDAAGPAETAGEPAVRDAGAFAAESTQRSRPTGIPVIPPAVPAGGAKPLPGSSGSQVPSPPPAERLDPARTAPSQAARPLRVAPGSAAAHPATPVETLAGPFPRIPSPPPSLTPSRGAAAPPEPPPIPAPPPQRRLASEPAPVAPPPAAPPPASAPPPQRRPASEPAAPVAPPPAAPPPASAPSASGDGAAPAHDVPRPAVAPPAARRTPPAMRAAAPPKRADAPRSGTAERPASEPRQAPPPGMTDADVHALYAKYVKAKQILGEEAEPGTYGKLLRTINTQAPKIMEQYKARGVEFSVVVKDNQVIIRAKPKP